MTRWRSFWMVIVAVVCGVPTIAFAQAQDAVRVRSGDHLTFTRLVFPVPDGTTWTLRGGPGATLRMDFAPGLPPLDLGRVFDLIPRDRLLGLHVDGDSLVLDLACDCPIEARVIPSGHVVIDISNGASSVPPGPDLPSAPFASLQSDLDPGGQLWARLAPAGGSTEANLAPRSSEDQPELSNRARDQSFRASLDVTVPETSRTIDVRDQIVFRRPGAPVPLLPLSDSTAPDAHCLFETVAAPLLRADPDEALMALPATIAALVDEAGVAEPDAFTALGDTYLRIGWGHEALQAYAADAAAGPQVDRRNLAAMLDDMPVDDDVLPQAGCGPASTLAVILSTAAPRRAEIARLDPTVLSNFLLDMHPSKRRDLAPRISDAYRRLGLPDPLAASSVATSTEDAVPAISGTGHEAVRAVTAAFLAAAAIDEVVPDPELSNALILRRSVPAGVLRDEMDAALAPALMRAGHAQAAADLIGTGDLTGDALLDIAMDHLSPSRVAPAAMRLLPHLEIGGPSASRAAVMFDELGLQETARLFRDGPSGPVGTRSDGTDVAIAQPVDPWVARNLAAVAESAEADEEAIPRRELASLILSRNLTDDGDRPQEASTPAGPELDVPEAEVPQIGDLAQAEAALVEARALRAVLNRMMAPDPPS